MRKEEYCTAQVALDNLRNDALDIVWNSMSIDAVRRDHIQRDVLRLAEKIKELSYWLESIQPDCRK